MMGIDLIIIYAFLAVLSIGLFIENRINIRKRKRKIQELYRTRNCFVCSNLGTMKCPNSSLCWSTDDKPYFTPKEEVKKK